MPRAKSSNITAFNQHGFKKSRDSGVHAVGRCPFCGKSDHFYVNTDTRNWDCKSCGKKGGFQIFLQRILQRCQEEFKQGPAISLSKDRGISLAVLRDAGMGYNPLTGSYVLPVPDMNNEKLWDLRIYGKKGGLNTTATCKVGLYGWETLGLDHHTIWLCEGEWDGMVMREILKQRKAEKEIVLAVPGAGTFKSEWALHLKDKKVNVLYDNDSAGREGSLKVYNAVNEVAESLSFVHWSEEVKDGYDLRDLYKDQGRDPKKTEKVLRRLLKDIPQGADHSEIQTEEEAEKSSLDGEGVDPEAVYKAYRKWLELPTTDMIDVLYGTAIANRLPGDPLWVFLVSNSGGAKTELLLSLSDAPKISTTTTLTPPALVSGANFAGGGDPSLIPKLKEKILIIKDFTTILSLDSRVREEVFGILRDAYDGKIEKRFGNGVFRSYVSKFGILAGVTPAIELFTEEHTALGERFLRYRIHWGAAMKDQRVIIRKAVKNAQLVEGDPAELLEMRKELAAIGSSVLKYNFSPVPIIPEEITDQIIYLAQWTSLLRSTINRDKFSKEITHKPFSEIGTRLAKQYVKLLHGIGLFRRLTKITEAEYQIVKDVAVSTVPSRMEEVVRKIHKRGKTKGFDIKEIAEMVGLPPITCGRVAENLSMLGVMKKHRYSALKTEWILTDETLELIEAAHIY